MTQIFEGAPSATEQGRRHYDHIMQHGTDGQREGLLIVLRIVASLRPGEYAAQRFEEGVKTLAKAMGGRNT